MNDRETERRGMSSFLSLLRTNMKQQNPHADRESQQKPLSRTPSLDESTLTKVHVTALDGPVDVNSLFTIAVFVGISLTAPGQRSLDSRKECNPGPKVAAELLMFEVVSFGSFLFSSLVAQGMKLAVILLNSKDLNEATRAFINKRYLRLGVLGSAAGSVTGCVFLMLSIVDVIQIQLGLLSCRSNYEVQAVVTLVALVSTAIILYISIVMYAFTRPKSEILPVGESKQRAEG